MTGEQNTHVQHKTGQTRDGKWFLLSVVFRVSTFQNHYVYGTKIIMAMESFI